MKKYAIPSQFKVYIFKIENDCLVSLIAINLKFSSCKQIKLFGSFSSV